MTVGSTSRNGGEFEFRKISLSLDRDLVPAENPIDAYRDIKSLLERMVSEFQEPKPAVRVQQEPKTQQNSHEIVRTRADRNEVYGAKTEQTGNETPRVETSNPIMGIDTVRERLAKWLPDLEILDGLDGSAVKPKRYLGQTWEAVNQEIRAVGGKWVSNGKQGSWRIPK